MRGSRSFAVAMIMILTVLGGGMALANTTAGVPGDRDRPTGPAPFSAQGDDEATSRSPGDRTIKLFGLQEPDEATFITVDGRVFTGGEPIPFAPLGTALLHAELDGENEVDEGGNPGAGDPDGTGTAEVELTFDPPEVCATVTVQNITLPSTGAHIHRGTAGVNGPVVVPLTAPGEDGTAEGCVTEGVTTELLEEIAGNPQGFYVNVHNAPFPDGAVRGQLEEDPEAVFPSAGDRAVFREKLFRLDDRDPDDLQPRGRQIGMVVVECTFATVGVAPEDNSALCSRVFTLDRRGDIAAAESFTFADPIEDTLAVTGGTGDFRTAGGQISFEIQPIEGTDLYNSIYTLKLRRLR